MCPVILKHYVAIRGKNLERYIDFYTRLLGVSPVKIRPCYAKFDLEQPPLNFTLNESAETGVGIDHWESR
jgi:catechol 2,3-dioxygenase-like lactoylglutathione lyase family enzyme